MTSRRAVLGMAGAGAAVAVAGTGLLSGTGLFQAEAQAAEALAGVNEPTFNALTPFKDALHVPPTLRLDGTGTTEIDLVESSMRLHSQMPPAACGPTGATSPDRPSRCAAVSESGSLGTTS
ncbi:twin-arginine translocation signal domain-containing protein [Streptomyces sp. NPDC002133]|uniref:twin-arginine translocation signal domain-containing protein n=1 Tax=Streptomyces sp. NPDC002133 TaxID=3154409 RepID=UPI00331B1570